MRKAAHNFVITFVALSVAGVALAAPPRRSDEGKQSEAQATIEKAIQAAGGEEKLAKFATQSWKEKGTFFGLTENGMPYMAKLAVEWPDRFRMEIPGFVTIVLNDKKGWTKERQTVNKMPKALLATQREEQYAGFVTTLLPLKDPAFHLALVDEPKTDGQSLVGVRLRQAHRDVILYFDKATGLLAKSQWHTNDIQHGGKEVDQQTVYKDYRTVEGVKIPMKIVITRDGKPYLEAENFDLKAGVKLDPKLFDKPQ